MRPKGFSIPGGYMGLLPNGRYQLFATEGEYLEHIKECTDGDKVAIQNRQSNKNNGDELG